MYDVIIIGAGPAGISASLYSKRAGMNTLVLYSGISEIQKASKIDNYYGFIDGISGKDLYNNGIKQAKNIGVEVLQKEVIEIKINENLYFDIETEDKKFEAKSVIMATGKKRLKPNIKGIDNFEGKGISYCAICDGFFYKNKDVVVLGNGKFAISEARYLKKLVKSIKILTNGEETPNTDEFEINSKVIKKIHGEEKVQYIEFEDGKKIDIDGIFIAQGIAGGGNFAKKLGIITKDDNIIVDEKMQTNMNGIFACGDITGGLSQVSKAVYDGAKAGIEAANYVKNINSKL